MIDKEMRANLRARVQVHPRAAMTHSVMILGINATLSRYSSWAMRCTAIASMTDTPR